MSKYHVGDRFEMTLGESLKCDDGTEKFLIKGFNALLFDDVGLDKLRKINPAIQAREIDMAYASGRKDVAQTLIRMLDLIIPSGANVDPCFMKSIDADSVKSIRVFLESVVDNCETELLPPFDWH